MKKILFLALCILLLSPEIYAKCISGDCINGKGTFVFPSGSKYVGEFKDGKFHGKGIYYFFNGSTYEGGWKDGKMDGKGKINYAGGIIYKGTFANNTMKQGGSFVKKDEGKAPRRLIYLLPKNTEVLMKLKSLDVLYKNFPISKDKFFGRRIPDLNELKLKIGFNPFDLSAVKKQGFDTSRELAIVISGVNKFNRNDGPDMTFCVFVPVSDSEKALIAIKRMVRMDNKRVRFLRKDNLITVLNDYRKDFKAYIAAENKYLIFAFNKGGDALAYLKSILNAKQSLIQSRIFRDVARVIDPQEHCFFYVNFQKWLGKNPASIFSAFAPRRKKYALKRPGDKRKSTDHKNTKTPHNKSIIKAIELFKEYEGFGINYNLANKDFMLNGIMTVVKNSKLMKMFKGIRYDKKMMLGVKEKPVVLMNIGLNFYEYYKYLIYLYPEKFTKQLEKRQEAFKKKYGVDLVNDIIKNLAGMMSFGAYDGAKIHRLNYNGLMSYNVKNSRKMAKVLAKIMKKMRPSKVRTTKIGGKKVYIYNMGFVQMYIGMKGNNVIVSANKPMYDKALKGSVWKGFLRSIKDRKLKRILKDRNSCFYLSFDEFKKVINNFPFAFRKVKKKHKQALGKFKYFVIYSKVRGTKYYSYYILKTRFTEPFFKGMSKLIEDMKKSRLRR